MRDLMDDRVPQAINAINEARDVMNNDQVLA